MQFAYKNPPFSTDNIFVKNVYKILIRFNLMEKYIFIINVLFAYNYLSNILVKS